MQILPIPLFHLQLLVYKVFKDHDITVLYTNFISVDKS